MSELFPLFEEYLSFRHTKQNDVLPSDGDDEYHWGEVLIQPFQDESMISWAIRQAESFGLNLVEFFQSEIRFWQRETGISDNLVIVDNKLSKASLLKFLKHISVEPLPKILLQAIRLRGFTNPTNNQISIPKLFTSGAHIKKKRIGYPRYLYRNFLVYCPECWKVPNLRYFRIDWHNPLNVICPLHKMQLQSKCLHCDVLLFPTSKKESSRIDYQLICSEECWNCKSNYSMYSIQSKPVARPDMLEIQNRVIYHIRSDKYLKSINDPHKIFGIDWQSNPILKAYIELVIKLAEKDLKFIPYESHYIFLDIFKFKMSKLTKERNEPYRTNIEINVVDGTFRCYYDTCKYVAKFKKSLTAFRNHILQKHSGYQGHESFSEYLAFLSKQKGFQSYTRYRDDFAQQRGFTNYTQYTNHITKKKGYKSRTEYTNELAKKNGYETGYEYNKYLTKRMGYNSPYEYSCDSVKKKGRTCKRHNQTFYELKDYNRHRRKEHKKQKGK